MKILIILILLFGFSCSTLPISEPASEAFSESLEQKARAIRSNPNSTLSEREAADDLTRAAKLIRVTGRKSANDQNEIIKLSKDSGWKAGLIWVFWVAVVITIATFFFKIIRRIPWKPI